MLVLFSEMYKTFRMNKIYELTYVHKASTKVLETMRFIGSFLSRDRWPSDNVLIE